jgi:two-component system, cell cycle response regulator
MRILLVGDAKNACRLRALLDQQTASRFQIAHVDNIELAAERLTNEPADVLLLGLNAAQKQGRGLVQVARAAAPDTPMVILAETEDESLAIEALRQGVQDFLTKDKLDGGLLVRSLRYSMERHRLQQSLQNLSLIDDLTGLHNRRGFMALAEQHLRMIQRKGAALLVYVDLDDLKVINDSHGHLEGNRALIVTANILRSCFRQSDILARLGGDEFCVLMTDAAQDSDQQVRKRLQERADFINSLESWKFRVSLSVGVAEVPAVHQPSLEQLLRAADAQMYEEKKNKQGRGANSSTLKQASVA